MNRMAHVHEAENVPGGMGQIFKMYLGIWNIIYNVPKDKSSTGPG